NDMVTPTLTAVRC
ncbi:hypothetical protein ECNE037_1260, partial [Escherichia coli NE037]